MDDPKDWQKRIDSLQTAVAETQSIVEEVWLDHGDDVLTVFDANKMSTAMMSPFQAIKVALGNETPRQFLKKSASARPSEIPHELRDFTIRDFYQLVQETMQINNCVKLLEALKNFSKQGFTFFMDGYYHKKNLPVAPGCPPRSVMRTIVNQVSFDLSVIQDAVNQRRRLLGRSTQQSRAVAMADQLANMALGMAVDEGFLPEDTAVVTYLAKNIRARLIPYFDALLISIAYASIQNGIHPSRDYLAIPHEIGHHLYWNGRHPRKDIELREELLQNAANAGIQAGDWRLNWLEEIFCDTYALLLAGPVIVLDFQDMLDDDMSSHFREDTDKHPIPEIRPFIQTNILRRAKDEDGNVFYAHECDKLDENWRKWLAKHPLQSSYNIRGQAQPMTGQAIVTAIEPLITAILDTVPGFVPDEREYDGMESSNDVSKLYQEFHSYIMPDDDNELVNLFLDGTGTQKQLDTILDSYSEVPFLTHIREVAKKKPTEIDTAEWLLLLRSFGWSDEGPLGSGGITSNGATFNLSAARVNNNVTVTVTVTNNINATVNLKCVRTNQTKSVTTSTTGSCTFNNVGSSGGQVIATNSTQNTFVTYPAA
ncbi:hypothetical protein [Candidatus Leptofilum sp.]|uniref:hypothetical protein n=1 Tax=Candidatus Leptofilum sp. TaxID=3241576 RepID=UPI003B5A0A44